MTTTRLLTLSSLFLVLPACDSKAPAGPDDSDGETSDAKDDDFIDLAESTQFTPETMEGECAV